MYFCWELCMRICKVCTGWPWGGGFWEGGGRWRRKQSISVSRVFKPTPWHLWASILPCIIASGNNGLHHTWWPQFYVFEVETVTAKGILIYSPSSFLLKSSRFAELRRSPVVVVTPAPCCSGDMNPLSPSCRNLSKFLYLFVTWTYMYFSPLYQTKPSWSLT